MSPCVISKFYVIIITMFYYNIVSYIVKPQKIQDFWIKGKIVISDENPKIFLNLG